MNSAEHAGLQKAHIPCRVLLDTPIAHSIMHDCWQQGPHANTDKSPVLELRGSGAAPQYVHMI